MEINNRIIEAEDALKKIERQAEYSCHNIEKYFDRIHDKLFTYQLFILTGYVSLVILPQINISLLWILIPFSCITRLIWIDYDMMKFHRQFSKIMELSSEQRGQISKTANKATCKSLEVIIESLISTILFIVLLWSIS